ncbi:MAG: hypothetical protein OXC41_09165 [Gammaproteobacteria bacterium]|nr:hypothetical protein [Gammaproteobacteria bacterium]
MGLFSSKKKAVETPKLVCLSGDAQSYKCIFLAAYRKLTIDVEWDTSSAPGDKMPESLAGLNRFPCIEEGDFKACGSSAALTYLNIKGRSPTIHPRKARVLAAQQYWIQVLTRELEPLLNDIQKNQAPISEILKVLDANLADSNHIVGEFSLADIHWSATCRALEEQGHSAMLSVFDNIGKWLASIKSEIPQYDARAEK